MSSYLRNFGSKPYDNTESEVRACRSCLETDVKLYNLCEKQLYQLLIEFTGIPIHVDGLPLLVCGLCCHFLEKFRSFKSQCHRALKQLHDLQAANQLTTETIKSIDRKNLAPALKTTSPEVHSYLAKREFHIATFHIDIENQDLEKLKEKESSNDLQSAVPINYVECPSQNDLEIKTEYPEINFNYNIKIESFNEEDIDLNNEINENDISHHDDSCSIDDSKSCEFDTEIKIESLEETKTNKSKVIAKKRKIRKNNITTKAKKPKLPKEIKKKEVIKKIKNVKKRLKNTKKADICPTARDEADREMDQNRKNALLFYNSHATKKISEKDISKRMELLEKFSSTYNVEIKFLSREEQIVELQQRKQYYKDLPFICDLCYRGYTIEGSYQAHMVVHDPSNGDYECDVCKIRCKSVRDREKHINATHLKRFKCKQCGVVTKSQSYAKSHYARHGGASYACDQCGKRYTQQTNYLSHMRNAHGDRARHCPLCYDAFMGYLGLKVHMGIMHKQAVNCGSCGAQFDNQRALDKHLEHSVDNVCVAGVRPCPQCGESFPTEKLLKKHFDDTHRTEPTCEQCGKSFPTKFKLITHMQEHRKGGESTQAAGFICETCGRGNFKNLTQLATHQRVHTGERPYKCSLCTKTFRVKTLLKGHMRVHTDERRYKCPLCPKAFHQSAHRTAHILTHTKERPYPCSACPKRYTSASAAREHENTVHRGLPARRRDKNSAHGLAS
ncbi:zinc-finger double domain-containing protein [Phthorimaea operculella]|nr:zinc-finger double domain-containing protein [Phthorimaea operculella]